MFKKSLRTITISLCTFLLLAPPYLVGAASQKLADSNDYFEVLAPGPNSTVTGVVNTVWKVFDNDQSFVPYQLALYDNKKCTTKIASLASGNASSNANNQIVTSWNSNGGFPETAHLNDGNYCMELCVSLVKSAVGPYSACSARTVYVRNTNRSPQITSTPPSDRNINLTESWSYDVNATDPDGDRITYSLVSNPGFLSINSSTGVITANTAGRTVGTFTVTVRAKDSWGASAQQSFTLTVLGASVPTVDVKISITSPTDSTVFGGKENTISWVITNASEVSKLTVSYSTDEQNWKKLVEPAPTSTAYTWDVSSLKDGTYYVQVLAETKDNRQIRATSKQFTIKNTKDTDVLTKPLIVDVAPSDKAEISNHRPTISGKFTPPVGGTIDSSTFTLFIDDVDSVNLCEVTAAGFQCTLKQDLAAGSHKIDATIKDFNKQIGALTWTFNVVDETSSSSSASNTGGDITILGYTIPRNTALIAIAICCGALLLLLIPWLLFSIFRNRKRQEDEEDNNTPEPLTGSELGTSTLGNIPSYYNTDSYYQPQTTSIPEVTVNYVAPETVPADLSTNTELTPKVETTTTETTTTAAVPTEPLAPAAEPLPVVSGSSELATPEPLAPAKSEPTPVATESTSTTNTEITANNPFETENANAGSTQSSTDTPAAQPDSTELTPASASTSQSNLPDWLKNPADGGTSNTGSNFSGYGYGNKVDQ